MTRETATTVIETMVQTMSLCEIERDALRTAMDALKDPQLVLDATGLYSNGELVIRCHNCAHYWCGYCNKGTDFKPVSDNYFCAEGTRK